MKKNKKQAANVAAAAAVEAVENTGKQPKVVDPKKQAANLRKDARNLRKSADALLGANQPQAIERLEAEATRLEKWANELDPKPAKVAKPKPEPRPVCDQKKKDGTACTARAMQGATYCTDHRPAAMHLTDAELAWLGEHTTPQLVALFGWGKVRQAYKNAHPQTEKAQG